MDDKVAGFAADFIQFTLTLVIGSLGFTMGIILKPIGFSQRSKWLLVISTVFLFISIVAGMGAWSGIPAMMAKNIFSLDDPLFVTFGRIHQLSFVAGIACIAISLLSHLLRKEKTSNKKQTHNEDIQEKPQ